MQDVSVVFAAHGRWSHEALKECFRPDIYLSLEATQCTAPEQSVPLAAFKEHIKTVILMGDVEQPGPVIKSTGTNEAGNTLSVSLFERLAFHGYPVVKLPR